MASVDETWRQERLFIARCEDVRALLDRMAAYRDAQATARAQGHAAWRSRLGDLLELAEARVVALKARATARPVVRPEARPASTTATTPPEVPRREPSARAPAPALTGADLVRWRKQRGLTQRAAAALLGVAHGTVGKAETVPRRALGEALTVALGRALGRERGGG